MKELCIYKTKSGGFYFSNIKHYATGSTLRRAPLVVCDITCSPSPASVLSSSIFLMIKSKFICKGVALAIEEPGKKKLPQIMIQKRMPATQSVILIQGLLSSNRFKHSQILLHENSLVATDYNRNLTGSNSLVFQYFSVHMHHTHPHI